MIGRPLIEEFVAEQARPILIAKTALTLDGKIATRAGDSKWISGPEAREQVMRDRRICSGVLVGANTARNDQPRLTSRLPDASPEEFAPRRLLLDPNFGTLASMDSLSLFNDDWVGNTCLIAREAALQQHPEALRRLDEKGICVWLLPDKRDGGIDLSTLVPRMRAEGLDSLYIEGGGRTLSSFLNAGLIDYLIAVVCPKILGDVEAVVAFGGRAPETIDQALRIREPVFTILGEDCRIEGFLDNRRAER